MATLANEAHAMVSGAYAWTVPVGTRWAYVHLRASQDLKYAINQTIATAYFTILSGQTFPIQCVYGDTVNFAKVGGGDTDVIEIQPVRADAMFDIDKRPVEG